MPVAWMSSSRSTLTTRCSRRHRSRRCWRFTGSRRRTYRSCSSPHCSSCKVQASCHRVTSAELAAVVLAAGEGRRLRPLTALRPKPLCPVANVPLIELAFAEITRLLGPLVADRIAVNAHHLADQVIDWVDGRAYVSR